MIHKLLNLTRPLIVPDTETTGTDPQNDRILELAFQVWEPERECRKCCSGQLPPEERDHPGSSATCNICDGTRIIGGLTKEYRTLVNPGTPIPPEVTEIHGIKDDDFLLCRTCGLSRDECVMSGDSFKTWPAFKQLAANLLIGFTNCDYAGKNVRFDLRILMAEFARAGVEWTIGDARIVDSDRLEAWLNKRSLSHLYRKYTGQKLEGAHGALTDVQASTTVIEHQMRELSNDEESTLLPRDFDTLHALQSPGMIDLEGKFQFIKGVPCFTRWGKYAGKPMTAADGSYWDWILKSEFSAEIKNLARRAKLKQFPIER